MEQKPESVTSNVKNTEPNTSNDTNSVKDHTLSTLIKMIDNPISFVKNTRKIYSKQFETIITEVQVQFADENPAWIPMDTLLALAIAFDGKETNS